MTIKITVVTSLLAVLLFAAPGRAAAEEAAPAPKAEGAKDDAAATKEDVKALAEELRRLKLELGLRDVEYKSYGGLGPAASKVYHSPKGLSIGGYGEIVYTNELDKDNADKSDLYRVVLYTGYRFNDWIVFNAEIEFEHQDELGVEFAYLDFRFSDALQLRVGNMLVPVGIVNELHEPPFFNGVFRPIVERNLIPSTWNENGVGLHGQAAGLSYKAYLLTGLNLLAGGNPSAGSWIRGARTGGGESPSETWAGVVALAYDVGPGSVGGSFYRGRGDQNVVLSSTGEKIEAWVTLAEVHASAQWRGLFGKALYAQGRLDDAEAVNEQLAKTGTAVIGSRVQGWYVEGAYDLMTLFAPGGEQALSPFVRYEWMDLHDEVPANGTRDPSQEKAFWVAGLTYKPIAQVALKADWTRTDPAAGPTTDAVNLGVGLVF